MFRTNNPLKNKQKDKGEAEHEKTNAQGDY